MLSPSSAGSGGSSRGPGIAGYLKQAEENLLLLGAQLDSAQSEGGFGNASVSATSRHRNSSVSSRTGTGDGGGVGLPNSPTADAAAVRIINLERRMEEFLDTGRTERAEIGALVQQLRSRVSLFEASWPDVERMTSQLMEHGGRLRYVEQRVQALDNVPHVGAAQKVDGNARGEDTAALGPGDVTTSSQSINQTYEIQLKTIGDRITELEPRTKMLEENITFLTSELLALRSLVAEMKPSSVPDAAAVAVLQSGCRQSSVSDNATLESIVESALAARLLPLKSAISVLEERVRNLTRTGDTKPQHEASEMHAHFVELLETQRLQVQQAFKVMEKQLEVVFEAVLGSSSFSNSVVGTSASQVLMPASFAQASSSSVDSDAVHERALTDRVNTLEGQMKVECNWMRCEVRVLAERVNKLIGEQVPLKMREESHWNSIQQLKEHYILNDPLAAQKLSHRDFKQGFVEPKDFGVASSPDGIRDPEESMRLALESLAHRTQKSTLTEMRTPPATSVYQELQQDLSPPLLRTRLVDTGTGSMAGKANVASAGAADTFNNGSPRAVGRLGRQALDASFHSPDTGSVPCEEDIGFFLPPLLLHFDVNKTVLLSDTVSLKTIEEGIRESISELFWGLCKDEGGNLVWTWTKTKPSCYPPDGFEDCVFEDCQLVNYVEYCKKAMKDKASRKAAAKTWGLVTDQNTRAEMEKLFKSSLKRLELWSEVRYTEEAVAAGLGGTTLNMFPAIFALVAFLQRSKRKFSCLFRSFGEDHKKIQMEWNSFCEMRHPIFSHLLEGVGPLDGSVPGVPDRRIPEVNGLHTLYRDAEGPVLILDTFTNGPPGANSWDAWAKQKPKPKQDLRNGRDFISHLKVDCIDGMQALRTWVQKHTLAEKTSAIKDDWAWWHWNGEQTNAGKLLTITEGQNVIKQIFFDDNIEYHDARIVDCRYTNGDCLPLKVAQDKMIIKVNPVEVVNDEDFFIKMIQRLHGDHLNEGYALAFHKFYQAIQEKQDADQDMQGSFMSLCGSPGAASRGMHTRPKDIFDNPKLLSLLFCYVQMLPRKGRDRYLPLRPHVSENKVLSGGDGEGVTITGVYSVAIDVMLKRALTNQQNSSHGMLHGALSEQRASDQNDADMIEQCRQILEKTAMAMQKQRRTSIGMLEVARVLPSELQNAWSALKSCVVGDRVQLLQVSKERATDEVHFMVQGMQSFFAASEISRTGRCADLPALEALLTEPWWAQMLNLLAEAFPETYVQVIEKRLEQFEASNGKSFLHIAASVGHEPIFHLLKLFSHENQQALDVKTQDMRQTPFHVAAGKGNDNLCLVMIDHKAAINTEDKEGCWALHVAMQNGHFQTARIIADEWLKRKHEMNARRNSFQGSTADVESLASRVLSSTISEKDFLDEAQNMFVELRYFDKTGDMVEKKREMGALLAVYWILTNQYDQFVRSQAADKRLSKESWAKLQDWTRTTIRLTDSAKHIHAMLVFVAIMSVGKIKTFRTAFTPNCQEFGEALVQVLQQFPFTFPSFAKLDASWQQMILSCLMAGDFNFGQFLQAENVPANLLVVKEISRGETSILGFFLFKIFAAMCGILGMKTLEGSLFMAETMYTNFKAGLEVLQHLERESPQQVYNRFLAERSRSQGLAFDSFIGESRAVVRLACMSRVFDAAGGNEVTQAFQSLDSAERERLIGFLNADGIDVKPAILLYNAPNILENGRKNPHVGLTRAFRMLLWIFEAVSKTFKGTEAQVVTIMVDELVPVIASCSDPGILALIGFDIAPTVGTKSDSQGIVVVKD